MNSRGKVLTILVPLFIVLLLVGSPRRAFASDVPDDIHRGVLGCEGFFGTLFGAQLGTAVYPLSNFNSDATITIESITVHRANGTVAVSAPPFPAGFDDILGPNERTLLTLTALGLTPAVRNVQVIVTFDVNPRGLPLTGTLVRRDLGLDAGGAFTVIRGLAFTPCLNLELE